MCDGFANGVWVRHIANLVGQLGNVTHQIDDLADHVVKLTGPIGNLVRHIASLVRPIGNLIGHIANLVGRNGNRNLASTTFSPQLDFNQASTRIFRCKFKARRG